ncbi:double-stranded RNA-specific adenosine deaminase-like [Ylistrum balloti]|uniref:double-stranded RNA-specific adenosine deaminase-like n=1 Tax=Ylistrum balloti TaxID=509963 RepID=UPI002905B554|nr:double-stranded RNA-specific adenosine deaminase-like [Ylistrum balloti]
MADIRTRILQHLQRQKNQKCKLTDLLCAIHVKKKVLNAELYRLQRQGLIKKIQNAPPIWQMQNQDAPFSYPFTPSMVQKTRQHESFSRGRGRGRGRGTIRGLKRGVNSQNRKSFKNSKRVDPESVGAIMAFLQRQDTPVKTYDIAKSLGLSTSSEVNPLLYWMSDNGQIHRVSEQPALWTAQPLHTDSTTVTDIGSQQAGYNAEDMFTDIGDVHLNLVEPSLQEGPLFTGQYAGASHQEQNVNLNQYNEFWPPGDDSSQTGSASDCDMNLKVKVESDDSKEDASNISSPSEGLMVTESINETAPHKVSDYLSGQDTRKQETSQGVSTEVKLEPGATLSNVDKLLQTLLGCTLKMAKSFVLVHKMKISQDNIMELIQEARKLKYVSDQDGVYVLDKKGEEYIRNKLRICGNEEQVKISSSGPNINPIQPRVHCTGKPLSPFEILGRMARSSSVDVTTNRFPLNVNTNVGVVPRMPSLFPVRCTANNSVSVGSAEPVQSDQTNSVISRLMKIAQSEPSQIQLTSTSSPHSSHQSSLSQLSSYRSSPQSSETTLQPSGVPQTSGPMREPSPQTLSGSFRRPQAPLELVRQQLKQTEISSLSDSSSPVNTGLANAGMQKLLSTGSHNAKVPSLFLGRGGNSSQDVSGFHTQQPHSLPVMGGTHEPPSVSGPKSLSLDFSTESFAALNKNPVSALMEYAQSRHKVARIEVIRQSGPSHRPKFQMGVFIGNEQLSTVTCTNKKDGRKEAADMALRALIVEGKYNAEKIPTKNAIPASQMTHFDRVAALTHQHFNSLVATIADNFAGRKVIAGLVMKTSEADLGTVISIGTGNRCITGQQLSLEGNTVNDSHAEIITRRGFIRFLYKKLLTFEPNGPNGFFVKAPSGKLRIRDGITFHLYISTAPCGDGALFSPRDSASNNTPLATLTDRTHHPTFTSQVQGLLRTKMEGGEGTIPVEPDFTVQTFDGIQRGERLRTMSCTDKICRWNVVGMQGALLSHFLEPVYLDSLTLGFLFDPGHLARAVCCRVNRGDTDINTMLPQGYHLNHPWLGRVTAVEPSRETQKTKALSINWCYGDEKPEVTDGTQGLCYTNIEKGLFSRCTKKNLYDSFKQVCRKFGQQDLLQFQTYNQAKMAATDFQESKKLMLKKMSESSYGTWVSKPIEEEMFS